MIKKLLLTLVALVGIANFTAYAQTGFTCNNPIVITALPYQTNDNTANYGDTTDQSQPSSCAGTTMNYMTGNDVFYSYTPTVSGVLSIQMSPLAGWSGIFVYNGCANVGLNCVAGAANSGVGMRTIPALSVVAGQTYIIVISTNAAPQTLGYSLSIQGLNCQNPSALNVANVTSTSADLSWSNPGNSSAWQVVTQPSGSGVPSGSGTATNTSTYTATNLTPNTAYEFWVRSDCGDGTFSIWSGPYNFQTPIGNTLCAPGSQCNYSFIMTDTYGDGWTGNTMTVSQNGNTIASIGLNGTANTTAMVSIPLCDGQPFELSWNTGGTFASEVSISIVNAFGQTIYTKPAGTGAQGTLLYSGIVNCASDICPPPINLNVSSSVSESSVNFSWTDTTGMQWEYLVLPPGAPAPTPTMVGNVASSNSQNITGLTPGTAYTFYVRAFCALNSQSDWAGPVTFTPYCPAPINLTVTATSATLSWTEPGIATQWEVLVLPQSQQPTASSVGVLSTTNSFSATGLVFGTTYRFYVRSLCSSNVWSEWSWSALFAASEALPPLVTNTTQFTTQQLVTDVLLNNPCMNITNITSSTGSNFGSVNGIGYFTNINTTFPLSSGIVLSTGNALSIPGPNTSVLGEGNDSWPGDTQLEAIISSAIGVPMISHNATKLEFDFSSLNEFMSFNFLFASDEYGTFQCEYSDAFAFLLTDLATGITTNLAIVPNTTTPISVVTIRDQAFNTGCTSVNPEYFDTYFSPELQYASATNFNGQTAELTASSAIIPDHPYHIKLVVADRGDNIYDSAVFIQAGSFAAGPPECMDKIKLVAFIDTNNNGIKDGNEVDFTYGAFVYQQNNAGDIYNISSPFGNYTIYDSNPVNTYDLSYQINAEYAPYYALSSTSYNDVNIPVGSGTQTYYFPLTLTQGYNDVTVTVLPLWAPPRPGMSYNNKVVYKNLGIAPASGTLTFTKDNLVTINNVSQAGITNTANGFTYNFTNLLPYETRSFVVSMSVPAIPAVNIGDMLTNSAVISAPSADINLLNNTSLNSQEIVASYDPNNIAEAHGGKIQFNQFSQSDYLTYTINFQNMGTANAINIRVEDLLDSRIDEQSIRMVSASHNYIMERVNNHIVWKFDYIQLPGAIQNEAQSKGYVTFQLRLKPGFAVGDIIPNTASIYFDTNPAIVTNTFNTEFVALLANATFDEGNVMVYPNPANGAVQVQLQNTGENLESIVLYDLVGKVITKLENISSAQSTIDISAFAQGIYLLEVTTENKLKLVKKLVIK